MDSQVNDTLGNASGIENTPDVNTCHSSRYTSGRDSEICTYTNTSNVLLPEDDIVRWYVLRFLYRNQPKVRKLLENDGIETFSPMKWVSRIENGRHTLKYDYAIWDLFFVHSSKKIIDPYVNRYENLQYKFQSGGKQHNPMVVPDYQMNDFITAVKSSRRPLFFTPDEIDISKGTRIRLIGGLLNGYEGVFLKVKGTRSKRLVVELPGMLIAAIEVNPDLVEVIIS